ncbi:MAG: HAD-IIIA family hydrolase [Flavobacteriales bacterium]|nr:HAD-IIIA family hydrolase [Flavobacteriales bacterium]
MQQLAIKFLVLDVDGVMTDGGMYYTEMGDQFKKFNSKDGIGIKLAIRSGVQVAFLSSGTNARIINDRAHTLGVKLVHAGPGEKLSILNGWCKELGVHLDEVAYIGDDVNDLECINAVGLSACPADAVEAVKSAVDVVLDRNGGEGCVREFIDTNILCV